MRIGECLPPPCSQQQNGFIGFRAKTQKPSLMEHRRMGWGMAGRGRQAGPPIPTPFPGWIPSLCSRPISQDGRGVDGTDLELQGILLRGQLRQCGVETICILDRKLLSSTRMLRSQPLSCSNPKTLCLCVCSVLGPPSWTCRSAIDLMTSP